ncbi:MAG: 3-phosphoserine/phosphohydroxythreonine transaminase [Chitinophagales bacterium]
MKKINFYSGPAILPQEVLQQAQEALGNFQGSGLSVLEISHRSKPFVEVMEKARALVKELMKLDERYEVVYLHGGALSQFHMVPYNLLDGGATASYFDTGYWAHGAMEEAKLFGNVHIAGSSREGNYTSVPAQISVAPGSAYLHCTSNNTIYGTQLHGAKLPLNAGVPLVCDMSSDIFSRELDFNRFDLIYAGAQKNAGAAGTTLVIVNKEILGKVNRAIPKMLDYRKHIEADSMLNTPSVFAVYVSYLTLEWIKKQGLKNLESANIQKAQKLYNAIDSSSLFKGIVAKEDRSLMNVCFTTGDKERDKNFAAFAKNFGIVGIEGHRYVGGLRASIYNAMPETGVDTLIEAMAAFEKEKA